MIAGLLVAWSVASAAPASVSVSTHPDFSLLKDARQALDAGRLEEAKLLIGRAVASGVSGVPVERLVANLTFASRKYEEALSEYQRLVASPHKETSDCEKGAIAALQIGSAADARPLLDCALAAPGASWRAWNARGVLADMAQDWETADEAYAHAHQLAPGEAPIINNQGWSMLIRGDWAAAIPYFEQAATLDGKSERIANNLELAKAALAADLPRRRSGESDSDWAARLNDAGVAAELLGQKQRAVAAFTQALDASPTWYGRASNNLKALGVN